VDTLKSIEEQIKQIRDLSPEVSLERVLTHLERAELHYQSGKETGDDNYFTDVVYRTNQAFEGSFRQSYRILADKTEEQSNKKRTVDIESFFETESIFNERVLYFFRNYRQEWRNKSTHDYKLFFDQSEAYLAIMNVSAYIHVLLNQIIEKLAFIAEQKRLKQEKSELNNLSKLFKDGKSLKDKVVSLIKAFSVNNPNLKADTKEIELIGMFRAFLKSAAKDIEVYTDVKVSTSNGFLYMDMLVVFGEENLIIEIKRPSSYSRHNEDQLLSYLDSMKIFEGIMWYPESVLSEKLLDVNEMFFFVKDPKHITTIRADSEFV
jgi:hypothetical protein